MILSRKKKVCVMDMDFGINQTICLFNNFPRYDLKDYLCGEKGIREILENDKINLYLLKSNYVFYDYMKHRDEIKNLIKKIEIDFDYILVVGFVCDDLKMDFRNSISNEIIIVINNSLQSVCFAKNIIKKCWRFNNITNKKIILNDYKVIAEINKKALSKNKIESILKLEVLFVKGLLNKNKNVRKLEFEKLAATIENNNSKFYDYKKYYKGLIGFFRRKVYEKFEGL